MQRVLSFHVSRSRIQEEGQEYVTKRLCLSVALTVTLFALVAGFFFGRFVSETKMIPLRASFWSLSDEVMALNTNLQETFRDEEEEGSGLGTCQEVFQRCTVSSLGRNDTGQLSALEYLRSLNACFEKR